MTTEKIVELPVAGMDCAECTRHVQKALMGIKGVKQVDVYLASEKAVLHLEVDQIDMAAVRSAVGRAGYSIPEPKERNEQLQAQGGLSRQVGWLTAGLFLVVLFIVIAGEWLGLFEAITRLIPWPVGLLIVLVGGYPIFRNVIRAAWRREVIAHTLMTTGVVAALLVGEWVTAVVVVFFMRVGEYVETFSAERARRAVKDLTLLAPQTARILQDGQEIERPIDQVKVNDTVIVRPGEKIPVDGEVIAGKATVDQSTITGESIPVAVETGSQVYAATFAQLGALHIRATQVGADSTFGQVIRLVEEAEMHKGEVQRLADRFTAYYLPLVAGIAALTFLISRDPLATAAVLVVACSCSIALATPIAMLASIGAAADRA
jgi:Cd2+/Zn2+-exporting ATPase/Cu+-exporting ATPase